VDTNKAGAGIADIAQQLSGLVSKVGQRSTHAGFCASSDVMTRQLSVLFSSVAVLSTFGQAVITDVGSGTTSSFVRIAPGQVVTVRVRGLTKKFTSTQVATSVPLPTDFDGVSVTLRQNNNMAGVPLPLIRGDFADGCAWSVVAPDANSQPPCNDPDAGMFVFQAQIPYTLVVNGPGPLGEVRSVVADAILSVHENGRPGRDLRVVPVPDQVRILRRCSLPDQLFGEDRCDPEIYHSDATPVSASKPARSGEYLVAYAYGLGRPEVLIDAGTATPQSGLRLETPVSVRFSGLATNEDTAVYSGLVPGQTGLYQVNFRVPALPNGLPACGANRTSNLSMVVRGTVSSDAVGFCAQP
jgi:hypothetical protein